jgi:hypothetical protein
MATNTVNSKKEFPLFTEANCKAMVHRAKLLEDYIFKSIELAITELRCDLTESGVEKLDTKFKSYQEDTEYFEKIWPRIVQACTKTLSLSIFSNQRELIRIFELTLDDYHIMREPKDVKNWIADNPKFKEYFKKELWG